MTQLCRIALLLWLLPSAALAQTSAPPDQFIQQVPEEAMPAPGFFTQLGRNLIEDVKRLPRQNSIYWWAGGGALALAAHQQDDAINRSLAGSGPGVFFTPGKHVGSTAVLMGAAATTYVIGRTKGWERVQHLGMDEIEAIILAEGITQGLKLAVQRQRPTRADGEQSRTYSFPSGHATLTFAAATVLQQHLGYKAGLPVYALATYVAMSRLHDNRHFASDVIFGAANGIVIGRAVTWHGRNFYATPVLVPGGAAIMVARK